MAGSEKSSEKSSDKEKHYANTRARRHSNDVVVHQSKKKRSKKDKDKDKDTDTESISSSNASADIVVPEPKKCPLRFVMTGLFELGDEDGKKGKGCPLRRVQLWHTIPLCLLAVINLLLVIMALLGLAGYRVVMGVQSAVVRIATPESPYVDVENIMDMDDGALLAGS